MTKTIDCSVCQKEETLYICIWGGGAWYLRIQKPRDVFSYPWARGNCSCYGKSPLLGVGLLLRGWEILDYYYFCHFGFCFVFSFQWWHEQNLWQAAEVRPAVKFLNSTFELSVSLPRLATISSASQTPCLFLRTVTVPIKRSPLYCVVHLSIEHGKDRQPPLSF